MASKVSIATLGLQVEAAYAVISNVRVHRLHKSISYAVAAFRDQETRQAFADAVGARAAAQTAVETARRKMEEAEAIPMPEVAVGSSQVVAHRERTNAIEAARTAAVDALMALHEATAKVEDGSIQPFMTAPEVVLPPSVASPLMSASMDQITAAIYAELKQPGGLLAAGVDA